jgi:hypothetical protein
MKTTYENDIRSEDSFITFVNKSEEKRKMSIPINLATTASKRKSEVPKFNPKTNQNKRDILKRMFDSKIFKNSRNIKKTDPEKFDLT